MSLIEGLTLLHRGRLRAWIESAREVVAGEQRTGCILERGVDSWARGGALGGWQYERLAVLPAGNKRHLLAGLYTDTHQFNPSRWRRWWRRVTSAGVPK
jgi:hypothetical protein